ncbi:MAG: DUF6150 family protein [Bacteroidota bacterium]
MKWIAAVWGFSLMVALGFTTSKQEEEPVEEGQKIDLCQLKGAIFIEETRSFADFLVFEQSVEGFADLVVYEVEAQTFATEPGFWYFTDVRGFADYSIYLEESQGLADFSVFFSDYQTAAGCRNR